MPASVTLNPGQSQQVPFTFVPTQARQYAATIDGLTAYFTAVASPPGGIWHPSPAAPIHWQWQIGTPFTMSHVLPNVTVYDIDAFDTSASIVQSLHNLGCIVIAYFSFGTWEDWRPDQAQFPASVKGSNVEGWAGEKWLDIRSDAVKTIMAARLDLAKSKGFDAIEPDNIDGYDNKNGFSLKAIDQINYNLWIATQCHLRNLSVGLKNDIGQIPDLVNAFDWALNEECSQYNECDALLAFINANKAVFQVEYSTTGMCSWMNSHHINSMKRNRDLTSGASRRTPCIPDTQNTW
jgi:hypothetical protein